jgi:hypothetical protein
MSDTYRPQRGLTFDDVWAAIMEDRKNLEEMEKKQDRMLQKTDRMMRETGKMMKETDKKIGYLSNRFGEVAEHLVLPNIEDKFNKLGYNFSKAGHNMRIKDRVHNIFTEVDIFLENDDSAVAVEVKTKLKTEDIDEHIERMQKLRRHADLHNDHRKYYGAIAGAIMDESQRNYVLKQGFYVIEPSGATVKINVPPGFIPRAW